MVIKTNNVINFAQQNVFGGQGGLVGQGGQVGHGVIGGNWPGHITIETWLTSAGFPEEVLGETKSVSSLTVDSYWYKLKASPPFTITA